MNYPFNCIARSRRFAGSRISLSALFFITNLPLTMRQREISKRWKLFDKLGFIILPYRMPVLTYHLHLNKLHLPWKSFPLPFVLWEQ